MTDNNNSKDLDNQAIADLALKLSQQPTTTCKEVVRGLLEIIDKPLTARTAWDAVTFAKAVIETLKDETNTPD